MSPLLVLRSFLDHRPLAVALTRREVQARYQGTLLGVFWSLLHPLTMLALYTYVFGYVMRARFGSDPNAGAAEFALQLFCGLIVHGLVAETLARAPQLVLGQPAFVKKIRFPLETLAWVNLGTVLVHGLVSFLILVAFTLLVRHSLPWTLVLVPVLLLPVVLLILAISWAFSALCVYLRDLAQMTPILASILLFSAPIVYPLSMVPAPLQPLLWLNPLTAVVEAMRAALFGNGAIDWPSWALVTAATFVAAWLALYGFERARRGFADVV